jgi:hypothetical protein
MANIILFTVPGVLNTLESSKFGIEILTEKVLLLNKIVSNNCAYPYLYLDKATEFDKKFYTRLFKMVGLPNGLRGVIVSADEVKSVMKKNRVLFITSDSSFRNVESSILTNYTMGLQESDVKRSEIFFKG